MHGRRWLSLELSLYFAHDSVVLRMEDSVWAADGRERVSRNDDDDGNDKHGVMSDELSASWLRRIRMSVHLLT